MSESLPSGFRPLPTLTITERRSEAELSTQVTNGEDIYDVIIAGAGPAGSSAAIHLAQAGLSVLLVEQKGFPRAKVCGEFISPECQAHFQKLGVTDEMMSSDPALISETVFYSRK